MPRARERERERERERVTPFVARSYRLIFNRRTETQIRVFSGLCTGLFVPIHSLLVVFTESVSVPLCKGVLWQVN